MSKYSIKPLFPKDFKRESLRSRQGKVETGAFAKVLPGIPEFQSFISSLPKILAGADFQDFIHRIKKARGIGKPVIFAFGAHVIKVGLSPILVDLMQNGWVTALAMNGAGIIHDFEIAFAGNTSEDVQSKIQNGSFGAAGETGEFLHRAILAGAEDGLGLGEAVGRLIHQSDLPYRNHSLLAKAYELSLPVTVHVAIGTDIIHFHPGVNGEALGKTSLRDFFLFCALVKNLNQGGIYINAGSAVILPEVFLKAVSYVRNSGSSLEGFSTAVFDFLPHYRPRQNVVDRPIRGEGKGYYFIGHHEIMIPLLATALKAAE